MNRVFIYALCFAMALVTGLSISLFLSFPRSGGSDIPALAIVDDNAPIPPFVVIDPSSDSPIRQVDFANFTYPSQFRGEAGGYKVRNGELPPKRKDKIGRPLDMWLTLADVTYGDVTGDGTEEAIIDLSWTTGGTASADLIYIYGLRNGKPKLLWAFETGDRAEGGNKSVFAEHGELVIELFGKDKIIGTNLYANDGTNTGLCCPTYFTRTRYKWTNNRFRKQGNPEVLPFNR